MVLSVLFFQFLGHLFWNSRHPRKIKQINFMKKPIRDFDKMHRIFHLTNRDGGINSAPTDGLPLDIDFLDQPSNRVCDDLGQVA